MGFSTEATRDIFSLNATIYEENFIESRESRIQQLLCLKHIRRLLKLRLSAVSEHFIQFEILFTLTLYLKTMQ